jgi:hypothetical protein
MMEIYYKKHRNFMIFYSNDQGEIQYPHQEDAKHP